MHRKMKASLLATKTSSSSVHDSAYVNSDDVDARIVLDVTVVSDRLTLNVYCAANHSGATCAQGTCPVRLPCDRRSGRQRCLASAILQGCNAQDEQLLDDPCHG